MVLQLLALSYLSISLDSTLNDISQKRFNSHLRCMQDNFQGYNAHIIL
jgi:hypothetical protein